MEVEKVGTFVVSFVVKSFGVRGRHCSCRETRKRAFIFTVQEILIIASMNIYKDVKEEYKDFL